MLDNRETVIDMSKVLSFRQETVAPGIIKYIQHRNNDGADVVQTSKIKLNISGRYETGEHAKGQLKYNPNNATNFNIGTNKPPLTPIEQKILLTMKKDEIVWVKLENGQHTYDINSPIYFRYEVWDVEEPKISFSNMTLDQKYKEIRKKKDEADFEFMNKRYDKANEIYLRSFNLFSQISKKEREFITGDDFVAYKDLGSKIMGNLLSAIYKTGTYSEAQKQMPFAYNLIDAINNYKIISKYFEIAKMIGDKSLLKEVLGHLLKLEEDDKMKEKYINEVDDILYNNKSLQRAFLMALKETEQEENREKAYARVKDNINIVFENEKEIEEVDETE